MPCRHGQEIQIQATDTLLSPECGITRQNGIGRNGDIINLPNLSNNLRVAQCNLFIRSEIICHSFTMEWSIWGRETDWWHKRFKSHKRICVLLSSLSVFFIESNFSITPGLVLLSVLIASFYLLPFVRDNRLLALNFPTNINKLGPKPHISGSWQLTWKENIILDEQFYDLLK